MLFVGLGLMSKAQDEGMQKKKMIMKHQTDYAKLKTDLGLTDKQVADWKKLDEDMKPSMDEMHKGHTEDMNKMKMKHQTEMDNMDLLRNDKLKNILSKEQFEKYQQSRPNMMKKKMGMMHDKDDQ